VNKDVGYNKNKNNKIRPMRSVPDLRISEYLRRAEIKTKGLCERRVQTAARSSSTCSVHTLQICKRSSKDLTQNPNIGDHIDSNITGARPWKLQEIFITTPTDRNCIMCA